MLKWPMRQSLKDLHYIFLVIQAASHGLTMVILSC